MPAPSQRPLICFRILLVLFVMSVTHAAVAQDGSRLPTDSSLGVSPSLENPLDAAMSPDVWRRERRIIDLHQHIETSPPRYQRAISILDRSGVGIGVVLGAGTVTSRDGQPSEFQKARELSESHFPGRFLHHMILDYHGWDDPGWSDRAVGQIEGDIVSGRPV